MGVLPCSGWGYSKELFPGGGVYRVMRWLLIVTLVWTSHAQTVLPSPEGPYPVGRTTMLWKDAAEREILAYAFYPAMGVGRQVEYFPGLKDLASAPETRLLAQQFGSLWTAVADGSIRTHFYDTPPLSAGARTFPVLLFSPGAVAPVLAYQLQLQELASRGYVLFGLEHGTDSALLIRPDGTLLPHVTQRPPDQGPPTVEGLVAIEEETVRRTSDLRFVLQQVRSLPGSSPFYGRLDLAHIGAFGHSMGGRAAIRLCQDDPTILACLNQDGEMFGLTATTPMRLVPTLRTSALIEPAIAILHVEESPPPEAQLAALGATRAQYDAWRAGKGDALRTFLRSQATNATLITAKLPGFVHASFFDMRLLTPTPAETSIANHRTAVEITRRFFDAYVRLNEREWRSFTTIPTAGLAFEHFAASRP
jgi:dienelactone hydrolase